MLIECLLYGLMVFSALNIYHSYGVGRVNIDEASGCINSYGIIKTMNGEHIICLPKDDFLLRVP